MDLLRAPVSLSLQDSKRHLPFAFACPAGMRELHLEWRFSPPSAGELKTLVTLSLTGPDGFRGAGHRHGDHQQVRVGAASTPGYLSGPIPAGEWTVTLHTHLVTGETTGELVVTGLEEATQEAEARVLPAPERTGPTPTPSPGWMMGDLHCHTQHSDGRWTPGELALAAVQRGLSFLALTDHNTLSARAELARHFPGLTLPGLELTTFYGHATAIGVPEYLDWTGLHPDSGMRELAAQMGARGGQLTIAHPFAVGDPVCTGCAWTTFDLRPENTTHLEVWNGPWAGRHNERALGYWYRLLGEGRRVVATTGTDAHGPAYLPGVAFTCTPATNDPQTLLAQLRSGETYLSGSATLEPSFLAPDGLVPLGGEGGAGRWQVSLGGLDLPETGVLTFVVDGQRFPEPLASGQSVTRAFEVRRWINVEVRGEGGALLALTNPGYVRGA